MNNTTILCFIFLGILLITIGIMNNKQCPPEKIIYKYIPKTFDQEQDNPEYVSDIFKSMFRLEDQWRRNKVSYDSRKMEDINKYFISQS